MSHLQNIETAKQWLKDGYQNPRFLDREVKATILKALALMEHDLKRKMILED